MKKIILVVAFLIVTLNLTACNIDPYVFEKEVKCTVIKKDYQAGYMTTTPMTTVSPNGTLSTTMITQYHSDEYYVKVEYKELGITNNFESKSLYDKVKEGDEITLYLYKNKDNNKYDLRTYKKENKEK